MRKIDKLVLKMGGATGQGIQANLLKLEKSRNRSSPGAFREGGSLLTPF